MVRFADFVVPLKAPERTAAVCEATPIVETVKFAVEEPAGTVTIVGTDALELVELNATATPPMGADRAKLIVPTTEFPPKTDDDANVIPVRSGD